jgi:hypothetical protein
MSACYAPAFSLSSNAFKLFITCFLFRWQHYFYPSFPNLGEQGPSPLLDSARTISIVRVTLDQFRKITTPWTQPIHFINLIGTVI